MVVYCAKSVFYSGTMFLMSDLRRSGSFCDITLTVGQDQVQAHRCVLAAGSQYFHSLFLGQFVEASMQNINLSEVTNDVKALEQVIEFMYTGKISITDSNLGVIVKLSTFFLIDPLREFCLEYMIKFLNLRTCLRLYLYAVEHSLANIEKEAKLIVMSRFHDYVILEENLELSADEVLFLLSNNMFQHCTTNSILHFVIKWLTDGITDQRIIAANQILEKVVIKNIGPAASSSLSERQKSQSVQMFARLKESLQDNKGATAEKFVKRAQQILTKVFPKLETLSKNYNLRLGSTPKKKDPCFDMEAVVVTLSPRQCVMDVMDQTKPSHFPDAVSYVEPVFTLCCYTPRTKSWYYIRDFEAEGIMGELSEELFFGGLMSAMFKEELVLLCNAEEVHFYNLRSKLWKTVNVNDLYGTIDLEEDELISGYDYCFVTGNNSLYLIMKVKIFDHTAANDPAGEYFRGLRLDEGTDTWTTIFKTDIERNHACSYSEIQAKISLVSNELIFTAGPNLENGYNYVFIVNLNDTNPVPMNISKEYVQVTEKGLAGVGITQTRSHFYIVYDGTTVSGFGDVRVVYEYKFNSLNLTKPQEEFQTCLKINKLEGLEEETFPCLDELTAVNNKSLWLFEGNKNSVSFLHEVVVSRNRKVTCREHTPPPFSCITGMFVGQLPADLFGHMQPVQRFLHSDRNRQC